MQLFCHNDFSLEKEIAFNFNVNYLKASISPTQKGGGQLNNHMTRLASRRLHS